MIEVVRSYYLILDSFIVQQHRMFRPIALEYVQILNSELIVLVPPDSQSLFTPRLPLLESCPIQQIEYLLIVDLQERARDSDVLLLLELLCLLEYLSDATNRDAVVQVLRYHSLSSSLILLRLLILVALHGKGLA